ncbi:hypothetical protein [Amycolatopsis magusensis]|uniref:Uncharacterized protein n=1 Tax=Amycolatopsis magusensis TaxID=882444 RepID=A0ABS4PJC1_9PSEU|nr:hypothetical protein [Amycolatopsis magusensis]MBP2179522.1 hypothetical protein [Amycolatopsis magusensis]
MRQASKVQRIAVASAAGLAGVAVGVTAVNLLSGDEEPTPTNTAAAQPAAPKPAPAAVPVVPQPAAVPAVAPPAASPAVPKAVAKPATKPAVKPVVKVKEQRSPVRQAVRAPQVTEKPKFVVALPEKPPEKTAEKSKLDKAKGAVDEAEKQVGEAEKSLGQAKSKLKEAKGELGQARREHKGSRDFQKKLREQRSDHKKKPEKVEVKLSSSDVKPGESRTISKKTGNGSVSVFVTNGA